MSVYKDVVLYLCNPSLLSPLPPPPSSNFNKSPSGKGVEYLVVYRIYSALLNIYILSKMNQ